MRSIELQAQNYGAVTIAFFRTIVFVHEQLLKYATFYRLKRQKQV
jgi:hypothetical protein